MSTPKAKKRNVSAAKRRTTILEARVKYLEEHLGLVESATVKAIFDFAEKLEKLDARLSQNNPPA